LIVVGDGPLRRLLPAVRRQTKALSWRPYITDSQILRRYYHAADLFVHSGVVETFGLVSLESQACGCPVVGIRGTNMDPNILAGLELWASQNTPEELANAVERMLQADLPALGQVAAEGVARNFPWPVVLADLWKYYHTVPH
jgi:alpha-1,6-mannosyltransferase